MGMFRNRLCLRLRVLLRRIDDISLRATRINRIKGITGEQNQAWFIAFQHERVIGDIDDDKLVHHILLPCAGAILKCDGVAHV